MNAPDSAYPLSWPIGWPRCPKPTRAKFGAVVEKQSASDPSARWKQRSNLTIAGARDRLLEELQRLGARQVVLSTNVRTRNDGLPVSNAAEPADSGVAIYFRLKGEPRALACDKWDRVADNIAALAKHIDAIRGQVRWGVGSLEQAFGGYKQLTAAEAVKPWWDILGVASDTPQPEIDRARDNLLMKHHPDRGGSHARAAEVNAAYDQAVRSREG